MFVESFPAPFDTKAPKHAPTKGSLEILVGARYLIEKAWCRGMESRRDRKGVDGYAYCSIGAIWRAGGVSGEDSYAAQDALARGAFIDNRTYIPHWNDRQPSKKRVLEAFDRAIAYTREHI